MPNRLIITPLTIIFLFCLTNFVLAEEMKHGEFLVLTYHAVPVKASPDDEFSVSQNDFVEQMEYLRTHGYYPVSLDDILKAGEGKKDLPQNPVLLTFDDAYISYYNFVVPILEKFGYPSVLAVVGSFIDNPPEGLAEPLMNWDQLKEVASKRLVEVVSHTYDLHKDIQYNPQGNVGSAVFVRAYDPNTKTYETEEEYRARMEGDFNRQTTLFTRYLGFTPRGVVWPYGRYTAVIMEIAKKANYRFGFTVEEGYAHIDRLHEINRIMIKNKPIKEFIKEIKKPNPEKPGIRAVQVDLDMIYDPSSYEKTDQNLGRLIDRLVAMKVNTVFLQAFSDPEGTGNIKSVYFHNRVLPVKADIFSHAVHQMMIRDMTVYAWMPTLSIELPDSELNESLKVREIAGDKTRPSQSLYRRLTPFDERARKIVRTLYEDLAAHSQIHGISFQDDAYLTDKEDYHPSAVSVYKDRFGKDFARIDKDPEPAKSWARYKTEALIDFTKNLMEGVRRYRPNALFARNLYAEVLTEPDAEMWYAQNYELFLNTYDEVVIMAYPQMEKVEKPSEWFKTLIKKAKKFPHGIEKTVFKVQAYDWQKKEWLDDGFLLEEIRDILSYGGRHIAYYPDDLWVDRPMLKVIKLEMSSQTYPFMRQR
ncbi:MAG: poly-beta-1,6-N-acetyl-D-glucosamine N-deacetylase PgaB [Nitrospirae bacterium]|nr:poly-beta-1,6-N-acetyl-D-glucosamine N-deacetylase PgaB [Nitrospirota bacterium]